MPPRPVRPTTIMFVRHGVTPETGTILYGQAKGKLLSEFGQEQAAAAASRVKDLAPQKLTAVYSSTLERAKQTAAPIARAYKLKTRLDKRLMDADVGRFENGKLRTILASKDGQHIRNDPSSYTFPGGESFAQVYARLIDCVSELRKFHAGKTIAVVSHGDLIDMIIADAFGVGLSQFQHVAVAPASISIIEYYGHSAIVRRVNDTVHLEQLTKGKK